MYIWGKFSQKSLSTEEINAVYREAQEKIKSIDEVSINEILDILDQVGKIWREDQKLRQNAQKLLENELSFSPSMIKYSLSLIPNLLNKDLLKSRLRAEITNLSQLDQFVQTSNFNGKVRAKGLGVLTHYTAGNVFLGFLDSLIMGIITKNINIIKLSSGNHSFPKLFLESLIKADPKKKLFPLIAVLYWKGGDETTEKIIKTQSHGIMAWGGEEMVAGLKKNLPTGTKLIEYGPKISFSIISESAYQKYPLSVIAKKIAFDLMLWDQAACASPQNLFLEQGIDEKKLMKAIATELEEAPLKRGKLSQDEHVEIQKEVFKAQTHQYLKQGHYLKGEEFILHYENAPTLRNSPLNRSLILKKFKNLETLAKTLEPNQIYIQSCSILVAANEKNKFVEILARSGVKRFSELGTILFGKNGAPHDGRLTLNELLKFIPIENNDEIISVAQAAFETIPFYRKKFKKCPQDMDKIPLLDSSELSKFKPNEKMFHDGHIFSSGGTSGSPKYSYYSREEFNLAIKMIAQGLEQQGLKSGDKVANLFVAGNLWSSFIAIEKALEELKTIQLSIGGLAEKNLVIAFLRKFSPTILVGLPTLLIDLAEECKRQKVKFKIRQIYYAGEKMPEYALSLFKTVFSCHEVRSAGYASVDAGPIGYQCKHSKIGEHHLFGEFVHLDVIKDEAVITTKYREIMPVIKLKTGDRVEMISESCDCGSSNPKFLLKGRMDNLIHLWGCRIPLNDLEKALGKVLGSSFHYQVILKHEKRQERMIILIEKKEIPDNLKKIIWNGIKDLKQTHSFEYFNVRCEIKSLPTISRIGRTGKIKKIVDER